MITRQSCFDSLFKLKNAGIDVSHEIELMQSQEGIPEEVVKFLRDQSPQFQFYRSIQKHQRALMKNILHYDKLDNKGKIKVCSSLITRAMISVEYGNLDESLLDDLGLDKLSNALNEALTNLDYTKLNEVLESHRRSMKLFYKGVDSKDDQNS